MSGLSIRFSLDLSTLSHQDITGPVAGDTSRNRLSLQLGTENPARVFCDFGGTNNAENASSKVDLPEPDGPEIRINFDER